MFDFDEIEKRDPAMLPGDWVEVHSRRQQGIIIAYATVKGAYEVRLTTREQVSVEGEGLQKLGERERLASLLALVAAVTVDSLHFMAEAHRMHLECSNAENFSYRKAELLVHVVDIYQFHRVDPQWVSCKSEAFKAGDEEIARLVKRLDGLDALLTFQGQAGLAAQGAPSLRPHLGAPPRHRRWVVTGGATAPQLSSTGFEVWSDAIAVTPGQGLCRRLCAMVAARMLASDLDRELLVDWRASAACGCPLERLVEPLDGWFQRLSPGLVRQELCLQWATRVNHLWSKVLEAAGRTQADRKAALTEFEECHRKAFKRRLVYHIDTASPKWQELLRLQGCQFEQLPDFLQVECICINVSGWFYPPRPCDAAAAATERSWWLKQLRPAPPVAQQLWQLPRGTISVHVKRRTCGDLAVRSPEHLFVRELDSRLAAFSDSKDADGGKIFLATDDLAVESALRRRYGGRLLSSRRRHPGADRGMPEVAMDTFAELLIAGQGQEIIGSYGSAFSGLASLLCPAELTVIDAESADGFFRAADGTALDPEARERPEEEAVAVARDPSETCGFHLRGSWDGWAGFVKLKPAFQRLTGPLEARVEVRQAPGLEEFHVVKDCDLEQRFYPARGPGGPVLGPDGTERAAWRVRVPQGCRWLEVSWSPKGMKHLDWRLLTEDGRELEELPEPDLAPEVLKGPFFLVGSWSGWSDFVEMTPKLGRQPPWFAMVPVRQPAQSEELQVTWGRNWGQRFYPARGSTAILGPDDGGQGVNWRVQVPVHCKWLGVHWDPQGARSLRIDCMEFQNGPCSAPAPSGQFFLVGAWDHWGGFVHLRPECVADFLCRARVKVPQSPVAVPFQVALDRDWRQRFWPNKRGNEILGPGTGHGLNWTANVPKGYKWFEVTWDPRGAKSLHWRPVGDRAGGPAGTNAYLEAQARAAELQRLAPEKEVPAQPGPSPHVKYPECDLCIPQVYRYHSDGLNDSGWGCVYRNTQTILEVLGHDVPSLPDLTWAMGAGADWLREPDGQCSWAEPHDVAEYLRRHAPFCKATRLLLVPARGDLELEAVRPCHVGTEAKYEVLNGPPAGAGTETPEAQESAKAFRQLLTTHLARTRMPVLLDDTEGAFLLAGFRHLAERGPEYRVLDPHYGQTYAQRGLRRFDPAAGPDQFGRDDGRDQWAPARWVEQAWGHHNGYAPKPNWMVLLVN